MFLSAYLLIALGQLPVASGLDATNDLDRISVAYAPGGRSLEWHDAEERIQGLVTPPSPRAGQPLTVSVNVGSFQGESFAGPVTLTLKPTGAMGTGTVATVVRATGERNWTHTFVPDVKGEHLLEVAFFSTRRKAPRATLEIGDPKVPPWLGAVVGGSAIALALGAGLMLLFRRRAARPPAEVPDAPGPFTASPPGDGAPPADGAPWP